MATTARNVILFLTDQLRKDFLGCYGNAVVKTPHLDSLARDGTRFERAYTQSPICCPARASLLTGTHPRTHRVWHNGIQFVSGCPPIGDMLTPSGVRSASVGKLHINPWVGQAPPVAFEESGSYWREHPEMEKWSGPYLGFEEVRMVLGHVNYSANAGHYGAYLRRNFPQGVQLLSREHALQDDGFVQTWRNAIPEEHHYNTWIADNTIDVIDTLAEERFFLQVSFPDPHHPFSACEPYASMFSREEMPDSIPPSEDELTKMPPHYLLQHRGQQNLFESAPAGFSREIEGEPLREMKRQAYGMTAHIDRSIGRVIDHLRERGILDDTMLIFTSDHGELLGDHGFFLKGPLFYQSLLNIPIIIRPPANIADAPLRSRINRDLVAHVDLVPTVLDAMGIDIPDYLPGHSLVPVLSGQSTEGGDASSADRASSDDRASRGGYAPRSAVLTELRPFTGPNMKVIHCENWKLTYYEDQPYGELFDLAEDPEEHHNFWDDSKYSATRAQLTERLLQELIATDPPWPIRGPWA